MAVKTKRMQKPKMDRKDEYCKKLNRLMDDHSKVLVVQADNVGSNQLQQIRTGLRGESVVLMGKNTLMKKALHGLHDSTGNPGVLKLINLLKGNVGLIFTKGDLKEVREVIAKFKVGAPARVGLVAPDDVIIPPGNTGLEPSHTSFFQALNIPTKINKGSVEIVTPVEIIKKGDKVGSSEAMLLSKLGMKPFSYGLVVEKVYEEGSVYDPEVLDLTDDDLAQKFSMGVANVTAFALSLSYPALCAVPHMFVNAYKNVLALSVATDYTFPLAQEVKEYLKDPSKFAAAIAPVAAADPGGALAAAAAAKEEEKEESEEEENMFSLFDE